MPWFVLATERKVQSKYAVEAETQNDAWDLLIKDQGDATYLGDATVDEESGYVPLSNAGYATLNDAEAAEEAWTDDNPVPSQSAGQDP
jgi:hypothetical protein